MKINDKFFISGKNRSTTIVTNLILGGRGCEYTSEYKDFTTLKHILTICRKSSINNIIKNKSLIRLYQMMNFTEDEINNRLFKTESSNNTDSASTTTSATTSEVMKTKALTVANDLIKFFSEFNFTPSYRFINSLLRAKNKTNYVINYFMLQDHTYALEIKDKVKSPEFTGIMNACKEFTPTNIINRRIEILFGEPGSGKTTYAMENSDYVIVCSSDMLPTDLMQNFVFKDGKADFDPSDLWKAMEEGKTILLDEINMLPFESLRFLQGITDNKEEINFKGRTIKIHPDFKIIGTMNLNVNGQCIPLPAPLVDRAYDIIEYKIEATNLVSAFM